MASSSNGNGNIVDEFEEAFQVCLQALTKQESSSGIDKDEVKLEVDQTTMKFIDLARQMEAFFLQKRFLLSSLKPELLVKEDNQDLRHEIGRKDELIRRHYEKIDQWKALLADQQSTYKQNPQGVAVQPDIRNIAGPLNQPIPQQTPNSQMGMAGITNNSMQAQMQAQHMQQQQQQQMLQAQQLQMQHNMQVGAQQMFMQQQQQQVISPVGSRGGGNVGFNQGPNVLQGPLAYLEKTTSNIDLVGMGDGRR